MPGRKVPFFNNQIYHVFNRGIDRRPTFTDKREYKRAMDAMYYYSFKKPQKKFSYFLKLSDEEQQEYMSTMIKSNKLVEIIAFCFMPNHFHLLLKQISDNGISKFMNNFLNSYTRYFNTKHERTGSLFLNQFKAVRIETDEQLIQVSRYIHLNPLTSYVVKDFDDLKEYAWSSFKEYLYPQKIKYASTKLIMNFFNNKNKYEDFVKNQMDYQSDLHLIEHLAFD